MILKTFSLILNFSSGYLPNLIVTLKSPVRVVAAGQELRRSKQFLRRKPNDIY